MQTVDITRRVEFDAGHRIPEHGSKCRNAHGHRYTLECTVRGPINPVRHEADDGMVLDFGDLKSRMIDAIGEPWDHAFLVWRGDEEMIQALSLLGQGHKTVYLDFVPTVENMAQYAFKALSAFVNEHGQYQVHHVRLYETPNCWSDVWADTTKGGA